MMYFGIRANLFTVVTTLTLILPLFPCFLYVGAAPILDSYNTFKLMKRKNMPYTVDEDTMHILRKRLKDLYQFLQLLQVPSQHIPSDDIALSFLLQDYSQEKNNPRGYGGKNLVLFKSDRIEKRYKCLVEEVTIALQDQNNIKFPDLKTFMKKLIPRRSDEDRERLMVVIQRVAPHLSWKEQVRRFIQPIMMDSFRIYDGDSVRVGIQPTQGSSSRHALSQRPGSSSSSSTQSHANSNINRPIIPPGGSHSQPVTAGTGQYHVNAPSSTRTVFYPNHPNAPPAPQYGHGHGWIASQAISTERHRDPEGQMIQPSPQTGFNSRYTNPQQRPQRQQQPSLHDSFIDPAHRMMAIQRGRTYSELGNAI
ncbi:hypothetical protein ABKN59_011340 [Abortiporus biennis]